MRSLGKMIARTVKNATGDPPIKYVKTNGGFSLFGWGRSGAVGDYAAEMAAMGSVSTLFAIVNRLAEAVSQVEWFMTRNGAGADPDPMKRERITRHAALDLWNHPNDFYTQQEFIQTFQQHEDLTGEGWWIVGRSTTMPSFTQPISLWPVRPDRMCPIPNPKKYITGYEYIEPDGNRTTLGLQDVVRLKYPNPLDPYRGLGPVQSLLTDLDASIYGAEWNKNFFKNSAEPGGFVKFDRRLGETEYDELMARWREQHQGVANAHRVAFLEEGDWVERKFTMRDMQFAELRNVARETIREAFGFPKPMLGAVDDVNRANAEAGEVVFARWLLVPRLDRIRDALNSMLLPMFGDLGKGVSFEYINPVPPDQQMENNTLTARAQAAATLVNAGYNGNAVLATCGLPDMEWEKKEPAPAPGGDADGMSSGKGSNDGLPVEGGNNARDLAIR